MTLNISATESDAPTTRDQLLGAVEDELLAWNPREFIGAFRRLHQNAFSLLHLNVISILEVDGPLPMSRLAEALDVSVASATGIVDRMEKRGLVERRHGETDRRVVLVHPTDRAAAVFGVIDERRRQALVSLLEHLDDEALRGLLVGHRAMRRARAEMARLRTVDDGSSGDIS
ncbi:MAG TPA: MarR family transcriptional regulator [Candidatus Limnocylindrales bacterium]